MTRCGTWWGDLSTLRLRVRHVLLHWQRWVRNAGHRCSRLRRPWSTVFGPCTGPPGLIGASFWWILYYLYRATNPEKFAMRGQFYAKKTIRMWGSSFSFGEPFLFADLDLLRGVSDAKTMQSKEDQSKIVVDLQITNWESETRWLKSSLNAKPFVVLEAHTNSACARSQSSWFKGKKKKSLTDSHKLWYKI